MIISAFIEICVKLKETTCYLICFMEAIIYRYFIYLHNSDDQQYIHNMNIKYVYMKWHGRRMSLTNPKGK